MQLNQNFHYFFNFMENMYGHHLLPINIFNIVFLSIIN